MRKPTKRKLALKVQLLAQSATMAKTKGLPALTVDTAMGGVGRTGSTFYTLFGSKNEFIQALIEQELGRSVERFSGPARFLDPLDEWMGKVHKLPRQRGVTDGVDEWIGSVLMPYLGAN
ncbi:TetR/AcrR family transcriptional regulator, partial [Noviherbaspirillum denitrificans]|uniref:TetR/AcrR family transcriptional regulator n=1 Tax=Noviherbaspirillum denitrificans TaxID=1968433 RepID=UPI00197DE11C